MPISVMWQDGKCLDTMGEIDSNGSCDSMVSFNSCFSDESLEYLSAEEKACLMYLEETIQSLDTADDSGLSNDETDQLPARGNVANKAAHLSSSTRLSKVSNQDVPKSQFEGPFSSSSLVQNDILNYMVPTPFVLANHNSQIQTRPEIAASQKKTAPKVACELHQEAPRVPSEVNVVLIPPPHKIKGSKDIVEEQQNKHQPENVARRGPLSYEALVHLRKSASMRRTNATEAKTGEQQFSTNKDHEGGISGSQTLTQAMTSRSSKPTPPPVAPKPKMKTPHKVPVNQEEASNPKIDSTMPYSGVLTVDKLMNVRVEALCKLGLLKEDTKNPICQRQKHSESPANLVQNQTTKECLAPNQPVQTCSPLHQRSVSDLLAASSFPQHANMASTRKSATLERTGMGLSGSNITVLNAVSQNHQSSSSTVETKNHFTDTQINSNESASIKAELHASSRSKGFNVSVPSIGRDRREALRKLGLLKN
ncbi:specifically androgen-regulated gene protein-like isoform X1 [Sinocyclocheilus anshuiensis]|uniref:Specifically androgen-regulated gene protein-like n=2 Tax=Sinocyclocheilus anshuiensis TaxID=1608454 RepID=A0A671LXA5_9TELE|nr:PREDICTED: specifically androgen-regulated gene protein-like isoform X1 [Sinocyclocheilus anshuiensis]XP_016350044.1 PREDICTED: specifically androgen-regulated gene protein-like isoform X1 [Sinocyclocheilus anshuiensis]